MANVVRCQCPECRKMLSISKPEKIGTRVICPSCEHEILLKEYVAPVNELETEDDGESLMPEMISAAPVPVSDVGVSVQRPQKKRRKKIQAAPEPELLEVEFYENRENRRVIRGALIGGAVGLAVLVIFNVLTAYGLGWGLLLGVAFRSPSSFANMFSYMTWGMSGAILGIAVGFGMRRATEGKTTRDMQLLAAGITFVVLAVAHQLMYFLAVALLLLPISGGMSIPNEWIVEERASELSAERNVPSNALLEEASSEVEKLKPDEKARLEAASRSRLRTNLWWGLPRTFFDPRLWWTWMSLWELGWMAFASLTAWFFAREELAW